MTDTTTTDDTTDQVARTLDAYFASWNEAHPARRRALLAEAWTEDGRHVDPLADVTGLDDLAAMIAGVQERFPNHRFVRTSGFDRHHDQVRYGWQLVGPDGTVIVTALDVADLATDGRIRRVAAFFHDLPALGG